MRNMFTSCLRFSGFAMLLAVLVSAGEAKAQDLPKAVLDKDGVIRLPVDLPLSGNYVFDMDTFSFDTDVAAVNFLSDKSTDTYYVRALPHLKQGVLSLNMTGRENWTVGQWNAELAKGGAVRPIKQAK